MGAVDAFPFHFAVDTHGYNINWKVNVVVTGLEELQLLLYCEKIGRHPARLDWRAHSSANGDVFQRFAYPDFPQAEVELLYSRTAPNPLELTLRLSDLLPLIPLLETLTLAAVEDLPLQEGVPAPRLQALQQFCSTQSSSMDLLGLVA